MVNDNTSVAAEADDGVRQVWEAEAERVGVMY